MSNVALDRPLTPAADQEAPLAFLRLLMRQCRAKPRIEVFEACSLLHHNPQQGAQAYADALLRILSAVLPRGLVIHRLGALERSFDERWLLALLLAVAGQDHASASFLLRSRLPLHVRRHVDWLATQLALRIDGVTDRNGQD
ncbi:MAG: hypothetical protein ACXIU8_00465 [Alkalilacustris sp.]